MSAFVCVLATGCGASGGGSDGRSDGGLTEGSTSETPPDAGSDVHADSNLTPNGALTDAPAAETSPDSSGADLAVEEAPCTPGATRCWGNGTQSCDDSGRWSAPTSCAAWTPACADGACTAPPSCQQAGDGQTNCGSEKESCCASVLLPAGAFYRTYLNEGSGAQGLSALARITPFRLDKYEVTVGRFRRFLAAWNGGAGWVPPPGSGKHAHLNAGRGLVELRTDGVSAFEPGWDPKDTDELVLITDHFDPSKSNAAPTWTDQAGANEQRPINCVDWYDAYAFCIWDGGFLPSDAEWVYATAGGAEEREYPWGTTAPGTDNRYAIYGLDKFCYYPTGTFAPCMDAGSMAPVGTALLGTGRWGQLDLVGNVAEWNLDSPGAVFNSPGSNLADLPCDDCVWQTGSLKTIRGGGFDEAAEQLAVGSQSGTSALTVKTDLGFRCARSP